MHPVPQLPSSLKAVHRLPKLHLRYVTAKPIIIVSVNKVDILYLMKEREADARADRGDHRFDPREPCVISNVIPAARSFSKTLKANIAAVRSRIRFSLVHEFENSSIGVMDEERFRSYVAEMDFWETVEGFAAQGKHALSTSEIVDEWWLCIRELKVVEPITSRIHGSRCT